MSVKDILAIVQAADEDDAVLRAAEALAARFGAHWGAALLLALPDEPLAYEPTVVAGVWAELLSRAREAAQADRAALERRLANAAGPCALRVAEALSRDLGRVAAVHARYADIALVRRPQDDRDARHDLIEGVLFHAGRPALVVPPAWAQASIGLRPLVAWDASREATRALGDAQPLMEGAERVTIVTVDAKPRAFGHGDAPGADIAAHLSRRGHTVEIRNVDSLGRSPGACLSEQAEAVSADLIVMGAYGHARLREMLFGGATRELLQTAALPLLMAH